MNTHNNARAATTWPHCLLYTAEVNHLNFFTKNLHITSLYRSPKDLNQELNARVAERSDLLQTNVNVHMTSAATRERVITIQPTMSYSRFESFAATLAHEKFLNEHDNG